MGGSDGRKERESRVRREGWMDARSQGFIPKPIRLQILAQQDVQTQAHTHTAHLCVYMSAGVGWGGGVLFIKTNKN